MISESNQVATTAEPWILLPLLSMNRDGGTYADYGFELARKALCEFKDELKGGPDGFDDELRRFVLRLYTRAAPPRAEYFLDKTPRYHVIASSILDQFPSSKAIILWRNPLSYVASMMETWAGGRWNLYRYTIDLYQGLDSLLRLSEEARSNVTVVTYESLILNADEERARIGEFLGVELPTGTSAPSTVAGELGDPTQDKYDEISRAPLQKWKKTLRNPLRKAWMRRYLKWIGPSGLDTMGYNSVELFSQLREVPSSTEYLATDIARWSYGKLYQSLELEILKNKLYIANKELPVLNHR